MKFFVPPLSLLLLLLSAESALAVQGTWFTDSDPALSAARKTKKPVLAVAMDHA